MFEIKGTPEMPELLVENLNNDAVIELCETVLDDLRTEYEMSYHLTKKEPLGTRSRQEAEYKLGQCRTALKSQFIQTMLAVANTSVESVVKDVEGVGGWNDWKRIYGED